MLHKHKKLNVFCVNKTEINMVYKILIVCLAHYAKANINKYTNWGFQYLLSEWISVAYYVSSLL